MEVTQPQVPPGPLCVMRKQRGPALHLLKTLELDGILRMDRQTNRWVWGQRLS